MQESGCNAPVVLDAFKRIMEGAAKSAAAIADEDILEVRSCGRKVVEYGRRSVQQVSYAVSRAGLRVWVTMLGCSGLGIAQGERFGQG